MSPIAQDDSCDQSNLRLFLAGVPGMESIVAEEAQELPDARSIQVQPGGVTLKGSMKTILSANLWLRTASRVLVRVGSFEAKNFRQLIRETEKLDFAPFLSPTVRLQLSVTCHKSRLYHSGAVAERVERVLLERCATATDQHAISSLVLVRAQRDLFTISVDSSGELLHRRGARLQTGKAPLRETLAAAVLRAAGYSGNEPLVDPMCGAGTVLIEAGLIAMRRAPGAQRHFAFQHWPGYDAALWNTLCEQAKVGERPVLPSLIQGFDRSQQAIEAARSNLSRARLGCIDVGQKDVRDLVPTEAMKGALWACNAPYGKRVGNRSTLRHAYRALGQLVKRDGSARLALLTSEEALARATTLSLTKGPMFPTGGLKTQLYHFRHTKG